MSARVGVPLYSRAPSRAVVAMAVVVFGCAMAYLGAMQSWTLATVLCFGVVITVLAFYKMEWAILGLVVMSNFDGFLKPLFAERFSLFLKDYFIFLAAVRWLWGLFSGESRPSVRTLIAAPALIFAGYVIAQVANPNSQSLTLSLAGVRAWLLWVPVFFIAYDYLESRRQIERLWQVAMLVGVVVAAYGIVQYFIGFNHLFRLSREFAYYAKMAYTAGAGERVLRVFSTMVHPGAFGSAMGFMTLVASGLAFSARSHGWRIASLLCIPVLAMALFLSGARAAMLGTGLGLVVFIAFSRRPALLIVAGVLLLGGFWQSWRLTRGGLEDRVESLSWEYVSERASHPFEMGLEVAAQHPFGVGVSYGSGVARSEAGRRAPGDRTQTLFIENDFGRALAELGVGAVLYGVLLVAAAAACCMAQLRLRTPANATLAAALLGGAVSIAVTLAVGAALYVAPGGLYFWLAVASVMRLPDIEKAAVAAADESPPAMAKSA
ncbi:MAG: hypothetical protein FJX75_10340 [Armatimonadetes bacterium]|nr:hypothetical protein [Armatimonadota bacterium]